MQRKNLEKILMQELKVLNEQIDHRIIRGLSYAKEAKRHKYIMLSLINIRRSRTNWFGRAFSLV
ncbi:MAG TPA: hypothetical protein VGC58_01035 [Candidatus Paceibacterota bacterium]